MTWEAWVLQRTSTWLWNGLSAMYSKYTTVCMTNFRQERIGEYRRDPVIASSLYIHSIHKDCHLLYMRLILVLTDCHRARGYPATHSLEQRLIVKNVFLTRRRMTWNPRLYSHFKFYLLNTFQCFWHFNTRSCTPLNGIKYKRFRFVWQCFPSQMQSS